MDILGKQEAWLEMQRKNYFLYKYVHNMYTNYFKGTGCCFFYILSVECEQATDHSVFNYNSFIG